jgi:hypothetical protein
MYHYPSLTKTLGSFKLTVEKGSFTDSEIIVMLGGAFWFSLAKLRSFILVSWLANVDNINVRHFLIFFALVCNW